MKFLKHLFFFTMILIAIYIFYNFMISPSVYIINNTKKTIKVTKGEFQHNKSDPELQEVENMLNNIALVPPKSSHSYSISSKTITSKNDITIDLSYELGKTTYGESFKISKDGFCRYKINVYDGLHIIDTSKFNLCYRKLQLIK